MLSFLTAKKEGGTFILRIDDTDRERSKEEYVEAAKRDLTWLGLEWDRFERQSDRFDRYEAAAARWKEQGRLYACYETPTELELKRKRQASMGKPPVYDRSALELTSDQIAAYEDEGRKPHFRFKLDQTRVAWDDLIRGETSVDLASVSDPVLIRADGTWLYTPCSVVDDAEMGVTHVVRGEDHVTNTATQIQMIEALGYEVPRFAHHSLLVGAQGEALSKRLGSLTLSGLREEGIEPLALVSLMARLGASDPIEPRTGMDQVIEGFDITRFGRAPARFDLDDVKQLNAKILHAMPVEAVAEDMAQHGLAGAEAEAVWALIRGNLERRGDLHPWVEIITKGAKPDVAEEDAAFIAEAMALAPPRPWTAETWKDWTDAVKATTGRKGKGLFMPLRKALTGQARGPEMADLLPLLQHVPALELAK
ncbi:MAG: glutamate--tRNA ligase [Pseudomonadota bacterium]